MKRRKTVALILLAVMLLCITGCGSSNLKGQNFVSERGAVVSFTTDEFKIYGGAGLSVYGTYELKGSVIEFTVTSEGNLKAEGKYSKSAGTVEIEGEIFRKE